MLCSLTSLITAVSNDSLLFLSKPNRGGSTFLFGRKDEKVEETGPKQTSPETTEDAVGDSILKKPCPLYTSDSTASRPFLSNPNRFASTYPGGHLNENDDHPRPHLPTPPTTATAVVKSIPTKPCLVYTSPAPT